MTFKKLILGCLFFGISSCSHERPADHPRNPASNDNESGFTDLVVMNRNSDAYKSKRRLIQSATQSIDLSYFIVGQDMTTAKLMLDVLGAVRTRSVKVRILVDYFQSQDQLPLLLFLNQQPNVEVRRFRPPERQWISLLNQNGIHPGQFVVGLEDSNADLLQKALAKSPYGRIYAAKKAKTPDGDLGALVLKTLQDGSTFPSSVAIEAGLNRFFHRTHHKLMVIDGKCFQMGGRNLADEYNLEKQDVPTGWKGEYIFQDTDVSGCESDTHIQQDSFNRLWTSRFSVPATQDIYTAASRVAVPAAAIQALSRGGVEDLARTSPYGEDLQLSADAVPLGSMRGRIVQNFPVDEGGALEILDEYLARIDAATESIDLVSAYFYADDSFKEPRLNRLFELLKQKAQTGKTAVRVYTNSIGSTDLNMVNLVAFTKYPELIQSGVQLFEMSAAAGSLHTKSATFKGVDADGKPSNWLLIGSYNLDARSHLFDTNNLLVLQDDDTGTAGAAFRLHRIESLRQGGFWNSPDLAQETQIIGAKTQKLQLLETLHDML